MTHEGQPNLQTEPISIQDLLSADREPIDLKNYDYKKESRAELKRQILLSLPVGAIIGLLTFSATGDAGAGALMGANGSMLGFAIQDMLFADNYR